MTAAPRTHLHCELIWGSERTEARGFAAETGKLVVAEDETAPFPLYGFPQLTGEHVLAEWRPEGLVVFPPPGAHFEEGASLPDSRRVQVDERSGWILREGERVRLLATDVILQLTGSAEGFRAKVNHAPTFTWIAASALTFLLPLGFLFSAPDKEEMKAYVERTLAQEKAKKLAEEAQRPGSISEEQWQQMLRGVPDAGAPSSTGAPGMRVTTGR